MMPFFDVWFCGATFRSCHKKIFVDFLPRACVVGFFEFF